MRSRSGRAWVVVAIVVTAALLAAAGWVWWQLRPVADRPDPTVFDVRPGWGGHRIADELAEADMIRHARVFEVWLRVRGIDRTINEGLYDLSPHLSTPEIARRLTREGRPRTADVVVPEGLTASQVAERIAQRLQGPSEREAALAEAADVPGRAAGEGPPDGSGASGDGGGAGQGAPAGFDAEAFLARVAEPGPLRPPHLPREAGLEGYLFPDTYQWHARADSDDVIATMVSRFERELDIETRRRLGRAGLSVHAWVTLASLVQAEAAGPDEMEIIAGVFRNRLDRGMLLQSDPTVAYGLGKPLPELSAVEGDLRVDHAWNTYTRPGLPAGPIGNPGSHALEAVLNPERSAPEGEPWLYFLHGTDGDEPVFRPNTSLAEHEADIDRYLR